MSEAATVETLVKPDIVLLDTDCELLEGLAMGIERRSPALAAMLLEEIERAEICVAASLPGDVVTIGSRVTYKDGNSGETRTVRLVLPAEADSDTGSVSILTPIGAGLIGMRQGSSIEWPYVDGRSRTITVSQVVQDA